MKPPVEGQGEAVRRGVALIPAPPSPAARVVLGDDAGLEAALGDLWGRLESADSQRGYKDDWRRYCAWLTAQALEPRAADVGDVQRYVNHLRDKGQSKATRARALSVLREVYRALVVGKVVAVNPAREVKAGRASSDPRTPWLNEGQLQAFGAALAAGDDWRGRRDRLAGLCLVLLGWRRAEVARIAVEHFNGNVLYGIAKGNKKRAAAVPQRLMDEFKEWRAFAGIEYGPVFLRSADDRRPMSGKMIYEVVVAAGRRAGLPKGLATPHAIRRSFGTITERRGVDIRDVQAAMAHESVTTTEKYKKAGRAATVAPGDVLLDLMGMAPRNGG